MSVRCYTCNAVIDDRREAFVERLRLGNTRRAALDSVGIHRMCCRINLLCHVDTSLHMSAYPAVDQEFDRVGTVLQRMVHHSRDVGCDNNPASGAVDA